ncbi:MAG: hypothetical protein ACFCUL_02100 [Flavobacteriaceae bacterium]
MFRKIGIVVLLCQIGFSQTGPGGVGTNDGTSSLKIWYDASAGVSLTGSLVNSVINQAGVPALDLSETGSQRPTLVPASVNGFDAISFSGSNRLETGLTLTTTNFVTDQASSFVVNIADNTSQMSCVYTTSPLVGSSRFTNHIPWSNVVYFDIGVCCGVDARIQVGGLGNLTTDYSIWSYDANPTTGKQLYRDGALLQSRANTTTFTNHASFRFNLGGNISGSAGYVGDVTEVIVFNEKVNTAQRIIIENYLAAKYGLTSAANDIYTQDMVGNGNFDYDVAGIGRVDGSNLHQDAQGTGAVRILAPSSLNDDEFLIWGHDNGNYLFDNTTDISDKVLSRLSRVWRVSEKNSFGNAVDTGTIEIRFDLSGIGAVDPNLLKLLVDRDNDGFFNDEIPLSSSPIDLGSNIYAFENVSEIQDNSRFTLAYLRSTVITNRKITKRVSNN